MKVCLIVDGNLWECPYVDIYRKILDESCASYDLIVWDRDLSEQSQSGRFSYIPHKNRWLKFFDYKRYAKFIKNILSKKEYDKLVVFGQATGVFLQPFLSRHYRKKYILDYRDVGIDRISLFQRRYKSLVEDSICVVVSSPGFIQFLPPATNYYLSHNFNIEIAKKSLVRIPNNPQKLIKILTIGSIRDFESNSQIIDSLGNNRHYLLSFIGRGSGSEPLKDYSIRKHYNNIVFKGQYDKSEEADFVSDCSMINIFLPDIETHSTPMANRFYLALIYRKPMIVTKGGVQGGFVEKYNLGVAIENTQDLDTKIENWFNENKYLDFENRCTHLLKLFIKEYEEFEKAVNKFIQNS